MKLNWEKQDLLPAICQDAVTGEVLMLAWMDPNAYRLTRKTGLAHFWSRSREQLWKKGATSGNFLQVRDIRVDCDADTVLLSVRPAGPACHTGARSCFGASEGIEPVDVPFTLTWLGEVISERAGADPAESYTARLRASGRERIAQKVGEEAVELALAAVGGDRARAVAETADLLYHLLVLLEDLDIPLQEINTELAGRHRP